VEVNKALEKLKKYCAYQERCHQEVRSKLSSLEVYGESCEKIIYLLITDNYLNEERYACSYTSGKFRLKTWGKNKIKQKLKSQNISDYCINKALDELDEQDYYQKLFQLIEKKIEKHLDLPEIIRKDKAINYAVNKGFESSLVFDIIKELETNSNILS